MLESSAVGHQAHSSVKRERPTSGSEYEDKGPSGKKIKAETTLINSTNSLFRNFVNNALDERAAVSFLILSSRYQDHRN